MQLPKLKGILSDILCESFVLKKINSSFFEGTYKNFSFSISRDKFWNGVVWYFVIEINGRFRKPEDVFYSKSECIRALKYMIDHQNEYPDIF